MSADRVTYCPRCKEYGLKEYHEIGFTDGIFNKKYNGFCSGCGFSYSLEETKSYKSIETEQLCQEATKNIL